MLGTLRLTCFDTLGLLVKLNAVDNPGGSGAGSLTYAASGSQTIASTTSGGASATSPITARGLTLLTFAATDVAGNRETIRSESIVVGSGDDRLGWACAGPTPSFAMPTHGTLVVSGTVAVNGITSTFSKTIAF